MIAGTGGRGRRVAALAILTALIALFGAASAGAAVYWGASDGVGAANLDGTNPTPEYMYMPEVGELQGPACGVVMGSEYLYWAAPGSIVRRRLVGESIYPGAVVPHLDDPCGLTTDGTHLYWTTMGGHPPLTAGLGSIGRANLDGSEPTNSLVTGLERPCGVAVEGGHIFWIGRTGIPLKYGIGRANADGSGAQATFIQPQTMTLSCGIAAAAGYLYWGQGEDIGRANLEGGEVNEHFITGTGRAEAIAIAAGHIYWVSQPLTVNASIGRANLDGSEANANWLPTGQRELGGLAVDAAPTPPALTLPSRAIQPEEAKVEYNVRSGAARFGVWIPPGGSLRAGLPPQGELRVTSPGLSWAVFPSSVRQVLHANFYEWQVRVRSGSGAVGKRIRKQLRERGEAKVKVQLSYTVPRTYPAEATVELTLRRYPGAAAGWTKHPRAPKAKPKKPKPTKPKTKKPQR